jgi:hypothetical protein
VVFRAKNKEPKMKSILDNSFSYTPSFETDSAKKFVNIRVVQDTAAGPHLFAPVKAGAKIETVPNTLCMKQEDINHYAVLNQLGLSFAHRRLNTEL